MGGGKVKKRGEKFLWVKMSVGGILRKCGGKMWDLKDFWPRKLRGEKLKIYAHTPCVGRN